MGWSIAVHENTLRMSRSVADSLIEIADDHGHSIGYDDRRGVDFDHDAMEHMDFLWESWALNVLSDPSVSGDVVFTSVEGDNSGETWGYRFKEGVMTRLKGMIVVEEVSE